MDIHHEEHEFVEKFEPDDFDVLTVPPNIISITHDDIKKLKVDGCKKELGCRCSSHAKIKESLAERQKIETKQKYIVLRQGKCI